MFTALRRLRNANSVCSNSFVRSLHSANARLTWWTYSRGRPSLAFISTSPNRTLSISSGLQAVNASESTTGEDSVKDESIQKGSESHANTSPINVNVSSHSPTSSATSEHVDASKFRHATSASHDKQHRFRNYSYSDYSTALALKKDFDELFLKDDAAITPVTAYQFIRNCGNKMSAESPENRINLVNEIWHRLKTKGITLETIHYNTLLSVYIQNRHKFSPLEFLSEMQENKIQPDKSTYMLIVQAYCQEGDLSGALRVIDFMSKQEIPVTEPIYTALVTGYSKNEENGIKPEVDTYTALIAGYAGKGDLQSVDKVLEEMESNHVKTNSLVFMNMLDSLCRHGHSSLILDGLDRIKHKTPLEMELRYFLQRLISRGDYESAAILSKNNNLWLPSDLVRQDDFSPYNLFVYRLLRVNKPLEEHVKAMKVLGLHEITSTPLEDVLEQCFQRRNTDDAVRMLRMLRESERKIKPHYAYPIVAQMALKRDADGILELLTFLNENEIKVDANLFKFALPAFKHEDGNRVDELLKFAKDRSIRIPLEAQNENLSTILEGEDLQEFLDIASSTNVGVLGTKENADNLAHFLIRTFDKERTCQAIVELDKKNVYRLGWILFKILESFTNNNDAKYAREAFDFFQSLSKHDVKKRLTPYSYTTLLSTLYRNNLKDEFFTVVNAMKEDGIEPNEAQYFIMLKMSSLIGNSAAAQFCFDKLRTIHEPTEAQYNALLIAYGKERGRGKIIDESNSQYVKNVLTLYEEMKAAGMKLHELAVSQVLTSYLAFGQVEEANEVKSSLGSGVAWRKLTVYNEYLRAFAMKGNSEAAEELFKEMKEMNVDNFPSIFSYNQLIGAHKQAGNVERVSEILDEMRERGIVLNRISYAEITKTYLKRGEPEKAVDILEGITDTNLLPGNNVMNFLVDEFMEKTSVPHCERVIALMRRQNITDWEEQRLRHILLFLYIKDNNFTAAKDIISQTELLQKAKDFLRENNLNYFLMDLALLAAHVNANNVDAALGLFEEKKSSDSIMTNAFLIKLSNFLKSSGKELPFDESLLSNLKAKRAANNEDIALEETIATSEEQSGKGLDPIT
eukprot:gene17344-19076_t